MMVLIMMVLVMMMVMVLHLESLPSFVDSKELQDVVVAQLQ